MRFINAFQELKSEELTDDKKKAERQRSISRSRRKGSENMEDFGKNMKKEMVDFVSYYR